MLEIHKYEPFIELMTQGEYIKRHVTFSWLVEPAVPYISLSFGQCVCKITKQLCCEQDIRAIDPELNAFTCEHIIVCDNCNNVFKGGKFTLDERI